MINEVLKKWYDQLLHQMDKLNFSGYKNMSTKSLIWGRNQSRHAVR